MKDTNSQLKIQWRPNKNFYAPCISVQSSPAMSRLGLIGLGSESYCTQDFFSFFSFLFSPCWHFLATWITSRKKQPNKMWFQYKGMFWPLSNVCWRTICFFVLSFLWSGHLLVCNKIFWLCTPKVSLFPFSFFSYSYIDTYTRICILIYIYI